MSEELKDRIVELEAELDEYNEIETDLNSTISYLEMGVETWKTRAEELEAELMTHQWVSVEDRLPEEDMFKRVLILSENRLSIATYYKNDTLGFVFNARGGFFDIKGNPLGALRDYNIKPFTHWKTINLPKTGA